MAFGNEHRSVRPSTGAPLLRTTAPGVIDLAVAGQNASALQTLLDSVHADGGGYVYFPPGRYLLGRRQPVMTLLGLLVPMIGDLSASVEGGDIVVYDDVTLCFAPGAVLVPLGRGTGVPPRDVGDPSGEDDLVRVEIHGEIQAQRKEIFAISTATGNNPPEDAGLILLAGTRVREVYPEWWGASSLAGDDMAVRNRLAIQAAFDAAHRHRFRPVRNAMGEVQFGAGRVQTRRMPTLPVVLSGSYKITGELSFGSSAAELSSLPNPIRPVNTAGFVLRGEHGLGSAGGGLANLLGVGAWPSGEGGAMLAIRGPSGFIVKDVSFNGQFRPSRCVDIVNLVPGRAGVFEGCTLLGARSALLRIDGEAGDVRTPTPIAFRRCRLDTGYAADPFANGIVHAPGGEQLVAVRLDGRSSIMPEFHTCVLTGPGNPLIAAHSGWFGMHACVFHSTRLYDRRLINDINRDRNTTNGSDVHIMAPSYARADGLLEGASFVSQEIETQSWQFLTTYASSSAMDALRTTRDACVLINYSMNNAAGIGNLTGDVARVWGASENQPSVVWDGPGKSGVDLILMGIIVFARVSGDLSGRERGTHGGYIHLSAGIPGRVFDLGVISRGYGVLGNPFGTDPGISSVTLFRAPVTP